MYKPVAMRPITLVTCLTFWFCVLVPSSQQQNNFLTDNRLARKGNDFITGLSSLGTKVDCYDRCYDAYLSNRNDVTGCICSQYDFHGRNKIMNCVSETKHLVAPRAQCGAD
ncbi:hypothetical protein BgiBS90_010814 [Biomphalaria glabrata]|uniref:Uncharacterized protein n=1 Tax=Biomphalaria glabrata TaxID=6526 RepID=A0A2C9L9M4_BIOGL|nr:hypothetical protein BgiBS90_010814 [Biomphalaria glabrata]